ncbi:hypothetical protein BT67DRAFT_443177 [Trichocladium antarcticum]|uniref:Peroxisomal membrane protein PEX14 n=1 Tax=Trichocladium antarcticum TaxID=1450529 RepID=A0AAN6UI54_9PEZI|nr:hypothetical protein BT67DRAFT_443177 [Trichocladium antarcticum]
MSDAEKEHKPDALAAPPTESSAESGTARETARETTLEQARKFLHDAEVHETTPERKAEFLKSKGLSDSDIEGLLNEVTQDARLESQPSSQRREEKIEPPISAMRDDRPPIVTYPEFLTKATRPPPLVTVNGFLNTLYAFGALSTLVYGTSKYVVEPMVNALTDARISLHDTANQDLAKLVAKLETTVSELPPPKPSLTETDADNASHYDDPTELFHRDIGVQTSAPASPSLHYQQQQQQQPPALTPLTSTTTPLQHQTARLRTLTALTKSLTASVVTQTESYSDVKRVLDLLGDDLDKLEAAAHTTDFVGGTGFGLYGAASRNEPDDEIRRAKENVRRVKGVLLSARSFLVGVAVIQQTSWREPLVESHRVTVCCVRDSRRAYLAVALVRGVGVRPSCCRPTWDGNEAMVRERGVHRGTTQHSTRSTGMDAQRSLDGTSAADDIVHNAVFLHNTENCRAFSYLYV